ncbi:MAG: hypothetical protein CL677_08525 [Bdellovibrionaceae bacterium]|nr:hypothetical protein [Pseudobdellovibrionaceae bacterium]|tara:strand:- start:89306 stop:90415 length:1110 start_codon:yes stop_codon:yes gene_type:complete
MKILFVCTVPKDIFSGGRYHTHLMASTLSHLGHEVTFHTNNAPVYNNEFLEHIPGYASIHFELSGDFRTPPEEHFDLVILAPDQSQNLYYDFAFNICDTQKIPLVLINFESPNWFNSLSPYPRDENLWDKWTKSLLRPSVILSSAKESQKWAKEYYPNVEKQNLYSYWYPPINSPAADSVFDKNITKENSILAISRFNDKHKGALDLLSVLDESLRGYTLKFLTSRPILRDETTIPLFEKAENFGINLKFIENPTEVEKFHEIQKSKLMLFPSYFEGFGYPPLEALYMDTPVVCYDLPVLRETTEGCDGIYFADRGNFDDLKIKIQKALQSQPKNMRAAIFKNTNFEERSKSLNTLVSEWTSSVSSWCK